RPLPAGAEPDGVARSRPRQRVRIGPAGPRSRRPRPVARPDRRTRLPARGPRSRRVIAPRRKRRIGRRCGGQSSPPRNASNMSKQNRQPGAPLLLPKLLKQNAEAYDQRRKRGTSRMRALLEVEDLVRHFVVRRSIVGRARATVRAVDGVSFSLAPGETLAL